MTVAELRDHLAKLPEDADVYVLAGEDGRRVDFVSTTVVGDTDFYYNGDAPYSNEDEDLTVVVIGSLY